MKAKTVLVIRNWALFIVMIIGLIGAVMFIKEGIALEDENAELQRQIEALQQEQQEPEQEAYIEGKYTLITDLSSSIYLNRIPVSLAKEQRWEDVNGVWFFDVTKDGTHYRYVEGHIEWPQLSLYAPKMRLEVVSDSKWPKE